MDNYNVIYTNLPYKVRAFTMYNAGDDYYTIILNARMAENVNRKAFLHELRHINNDDFIKFKNIQHIETRAHACATI